MDADGDGDPTRLTRARAARHRRARERKPGLVARRQADRLRRAARQGGGRHAHRDLRHERGRHGPPAPDHEPLQRGSPELVARRVADRVHPHRADAVRAARPGSWRSTRTAVPRRASRFPRAAGSTSRPVWSPDGSSIAFTRLAFDPATGSRRARSSTTVRPDGTGSRKLAADGRRARLVARRRADRVRVGSRPQRPHLLRGVPDERGDLRPRRRERRADPAHEEQRRRSRARVVAGRRLDRVRLRPLEPAGSRERDLRHGRRRPATSRAAQEHVVST